MNVSGASQQAAFAQEYSVGVAKKAQDAQKLQAQNAMQLIASASAPGQQQPLQAGQTINVMA